MDKGSWNTFSCRYVLNVASFPGLSPQAFITCSMKNLGVGKAGYEAILYMINPFCTTFAGGAIEITLTGITDGDSACTLSNLSNISNCSGTDAATEYSRKLTLGYIHAHTNV